MLTSRRGLRAAAFAFCLAVSGGAGALAQEAQKAETVGPPALKDFQLPGQRTTPPAEPPPPVRTEPAAPAPAQPRAEPARPAEPRPSAPSPARQSERAAPAPAPAAAGPAPAEPVTEPAPAPVEPVTPPPAPVTAVPTPVLDAAPAEAEPEPAAGWLWPAIALLVAALAVFAFLKLSGRNGPVRRAAPAARAAAVPAAPPAPPPPPAPRAWIELSIKADRAAATPERAVIAYELLLDNVGEAEAGNIRIEAKLFNAGGEKEVGAFFRAPMRERSGSPHVTIAPGKGIRLNGEVALPMAEVRAVELQGRQLFIPLVAISVAYDWADGSGRTSKSWLVGREAETPAAKMGAFRLDLGPRIYRSVGQREAQLVKV